jgi:hypothetical protein
VSRGLSWHYAIVVVAQGARRLRGWSTARAGAGEQTGEERPVLASTRERSGRAGMEHGESSGMLPGGMEHGRGVVVRQGGMRMTARAGEDH